MKFPTLCLIALFAGVFTGCDSSQPDPQAPVARASEMSADEKRRQALALAFAEVMRQQGHEVSVTATRDQLWFDCSTALEPRSSCYAAYQSSKHLPSDLKAELHKVGITSLNFSPNGGMIPTWATNVK